MKKWILMVLCVCIIGWAMAEEATPQPARYAPGEEVPLSLYLTAPEIAGLQMRLAWDPAVLEIVDETAAFTAFFAEDALLAMLYAKPEEGEMTILWMQEKDVALTNMGVLDVVFRVREDACGGETRVSIPALMLTDAAGNVLNIQVEELCAEIDAPVASTPIPQAASELEDEAAPTVTPSPAPVEAYVWLAETGNEAEEAAQIISERPNGAMENVVAEATPAPTPATVVLGGTPVPDAATDQLSLRVIPQGENFRVELVAREMNIGGLQATISYDPTAAQCVSAAFAEPFKAAAMIQMVNRGEAGSIKLVYSSTEGYEAAGEVIFVAEFTAEEGQVVLTLADVKCTNVNESLSVWCMEEQQTVYTIQPMNDLTIIEPEKEGAEAS